MLAYANSRIHGTVKGALSANWSSQAILWQNGKRVAVGELDAHGEFVLLHLSAGEYKVVVGVRDANGNERYLEKQVKARGVKATFVGHVAPDEVPNLIASMDLVVHPSLWEGLPRAAVQALLVGRPVVAFDCDGAREVVIDGETGRLVPPKDLDRLRAAIEEILGKPDRGRSMGLEGRQRCVEQFEWRKCADKLDLVYRAVLRERHGLGGRVAKGWRGLAEPRLDFGRGGLLGCKPL